MTWILPNNLSDTYPSVLDTKELGLDSDEFSQASEKSLTLKSKHSPSRTWSRRLKRESWIQHLSGRMLRPSHSDSFVERWTSSLGDSPASPSQLLGVAREQTMNDTSTHSSAPAFEPVSQQLSFLKMFLVSSAQNSPAEKVFSNMSSKTWNQWVIGQRQESLARKKLAHLIEETGYSSWPIKKENWMTPEALNHTGYQVSGGKRILRLGAQVNQENWGTPNGPPAPDTSSTNGKSHGQLNPNWVEQLMGIPVGWTQLSTEWTGSE